ncbi:integrase core domain-containing protein [Erythrobacter sp.]|uniref:integrase core domain-containing protein n=1 Tax=Erythrobacter sp. TaxID=1042 RepID=UPI001AFD2C4E|nr:transposase [Erythrobacter sp.]MBO6530296.1 transposase [Erythrobacter sp.]
MGEWLLRKLQREAQRRAAERRDFSTLKEATILIDRWRILYNTIRPHSLLGYQPLVRERFVSLCWTALRNTTGRPARQLKPQEL